MSVITDRTTATATAVLATATLLAVVFAYLQVRVIERQIQDGVNARKAQTLLDLRKTFLEIDKSLDDVDRHKAYPDNNLCPNWNVLKRYWYFTETEWDLAQKDPSEETNWSESQRPRVMHALTELSFRSVFLAMAERSFKTVEGSKFVDEVRDKFKKTNGKELQEAYPVVSIAKCPTTPTTADERCSCSS